MRDIYRSVLIPRNHTYPEKFLVVHLIYVKQKSEVQNESIHCTKTMLFSVCFHCERLTFVLYKSGEQPEIFQGRCGSLE